MEKFKAKLKLIVAGVIAVLAFLVRYLWTGKKAAERRAEKSDAKANAIEEMADFTIKTEQEKNDEIRDVVQKADAENLRGRRDFFDSQLRD